MVQNVIFLLNTSWILIGWIRANWIFLHVTVIQWQRQYLYQWVVQTYGCIYLYCFCWPMIVSWGFSFFIAWHDALLCFLIWRKFLLTVYTMLDAALRMFTAFAHICVRLLRTYTAVLYVFVQILRTLCGFCARIRIWFCALCADFAYMYGFCARWAAFFTYTAYMLQMICGFCVNIRLIFTMFNADSI